MTDAATPESTLKTDSRLRQLVDFGGLLAFGAAFLVMRLRGLSGDEALVHATWFLVAGSAARILIRPMSGSASGACCGSPPQPSACPRSR